MASIKIHEAESSAGAMCVERWAAAFFESSDQAPAYSGRCTTEAAIPASFRRRMGPLERTMARCALGVLDDLASAEIILCSRFGNLDMLVALLNSLADKEPLSPMTFSLSVHNCLAGLLDQIRSDRSPHTALACGLETLASGLVEAYCQLKVTPLRPVALVYGDWQLPEPFARFADEDCGAVALVLLLRVNETSTSPMTLEILPDDRVAPIVEGSHRLARQIAEGMQSGAEVVFRPRFGPGWRIGAR